MVSDTIFVSDFIICGAEENTEEGRSACLNLGPCGGPCPNAGGLPGGMLKPGRIGGSGIGGGGGNRIRAPKGRPGGGGGKNCGTGGGGPGGGGPAGGGLIIGGGM